MDKKIMGDKHDLVFEMIINAQKGYAKEIGLIIKEYPEFEEVIGLYARDVNLEIIKEMIRVRNFGCDYNFSCNPCPKGVDMAKMCKHLKEKVKALKKTKTTPNGRE